MSSLNQIDARRPKLKQPVSTVAPHRSVPAHINVNLSLLLRPCLHGTQQSAYATQRWEN